MKTITVGMFAHVDAGKTTLTEALLYKSGSIRSMGSIEKKTTFLDNNIIEKRRGITIFSEYARCVSKEKDTQLIFVDTPGHIDFFSDSLRCVGVIDVALLIVGGLGGINAGCERIWRLLRENHIPTIVFFNKSDLEGYDYQALLQEIQSHFKDNFADCSKTKEDLYEEIAACDEELLNKYLELGKLTNQDIITAFSNELFFPVFSGAAALNDGIEELLSFLLNLEEFVQCETNADLTTESGAVIRPFKITYDDKNNRLVHARVLSGTVKSKEYVLQNKINEIRIYNGTKYTSSQIVDRGDVCALSGLSDVELEKACASAVTYEVQYPSSITPDEMMKILKRLEDEVPELNLKYDNKQKTIRIALQGSVQRDVIKDLILDTYGIQVDFDNCKIEYKETIDKPAVGTGHYEPLKHFAHVKIRLEPTQRSMGIDFASEVSEDELDRNWQHLIKTHVYERPHPGVLTGSVITDIKVILVGGKAHLKHTEGGDFRQATYRAIRQGLMNANCRLLEPFYEYRLVIPKDCVGRAISDMEARFATYEITESNTDRITLSGSIPVATLGDYYIELLSYTKGCGYLDIVNTYYDYCHNEEEVISNYGYNPEEDLDNPVDSVYCSHGAGHVVKWNDPILYD